MADRLAKQATLDPQPQNAITTISYLKRVIAQAKTPEWKEHWMQTSHGKNYHGTPREKFDTFYKAESRQKTSQLLATRTGHGYFKSYLARIPKSKIQDTKCYCGDALQTPEHLLMKCTKYQTERAKLQTRVKQRNRKVTMHTLLHTRKGMEATAQFLEQTKIGTRRWLHQTTRILEEDDPEDTNWDKLGTGWGRLQDSSEDEGEIEEEE
jgi:hypothetical protein